RCLAPIGIVGITAAVACVFTGGTGWRIAVASLFALLGLGLPGAASAIWFFSDSDQESWSFAALLLILLLAAAVFGAFVGSPLTLTSGARPWTAMSFFPGREPPIDSRRLGAFQQIRLALPGKGYTALCISARRTHDRASSLMLIPGCVCSARVG